jgi:Zn-finger nucleic acid-binding protein
MATCPNCKTGHLVRSERSGVETDYCPECRSWLDHDKLTEESKRRFNTEDPAETVREKRPPPPPAEDAEVKKRM